MPALVGIHIAVRRGVAAGDFRVRAFHHQSVEAAHIRLRETRIARREFANVANGLVMIDGLQMIPELLAADRDSLLDHQIGFDLGERVPLDVDV